MRSISPAANSMPGTFSFKGVPSILAPFTTPTPSGSTRSAPFTAWRAAKFSRQTSTISGLGVTT